MARLGKRKVKDAIAEFRGNISAVARRFEVDRKTVYEFVREKHPDLWEFVQEQREVMLDTAEDILGKKIEQGEVVPLIFYLKTQGKARGYVERQEITGKDGEPLVVEYVNDWRHPKDGDAND